MGATYYVIFMMCLTTTYALWNWWYLYPAHPEWVREWRGGEIQRYRFERRMTLAVTMFTIVAANVTLLSALLSKR